MTDARANAVDGAVLMAAHAAVGYVGNNAFQAEPGRSVAMTHAAITAYLASMADAGWVMVRDVGTMEIDGPSPARIYAYAWNACRAAMLADQPPKR